MTMLLLDLYLHLRIRTRIVLLCLCYSLCIVLAVVAGRNLSLALCVVSTTVFTVLGGFFCGLLFWSLNRALDRIIGYLQTMIAGDLTQTVQAQRNNEISKIIRSIDTL